jgi:hypothetical protein
MCFDESWLKISRSHKKTSQQFPEGGFVKLIKDGISN